jgi:hypothetical protein
MLELGILTSQYKVLSQFGKFPKIQRHMEETKSEISAKPRPR